MTALDYPIGLKFGATTDGYSESHPHKGNDYKAPEGSPVIVAGTQIGLTGHTGNAYGPHVHVQAGKDIDAQNAIEPTPYTNKPGVVVQAEFRSEWGNFVNIKCGDMYVHYCHLSRIDVTVGQVIGGDMKIDENVASRLYTMFLHRQPENEAAWRSWIGRDMEEWMDAMVVSGSEWHAQNGVLLSLYPAALSENDALRKQLASSTDADAAKKIQQIKDIVK